MPGEPARRRATPVADGRQKRAEAFADSSPFVAPRLNNLPIPLTELIGRKEELAKVGSLLARNSLLTLTGAGGSGKTRLALALASEVEKEFQDGVCWVDLSGLVDGSLLWSVVGEAFGLQETAAQSFDQVLLAYLGSRHVMLILDNCEHLVYPCARLAERLLSTCPHLKLLATSRESLGIAAEVVWSVPVLSLPTPPFTHDRLLHYDAARLFVARAIAANPDFALNDASAREVAEICVRLDGIPLAIELAAARVKVLSVEQIAARLENRFELLTVGSRTALPRHQTLRSTIDWSYDLLTEPERVLFRRLAVFPAGFSIEAAERVCADAGTQARSSSHSIIDLLTHLVDKSLVLVNQGQQARYRMLETIRQYALEKLEQAHELAVLKERHFDCFTRMAEEAARQLISPEQKEALALLDAEHDNLSAAFDWALASDHPVLALQLASTLWRFWHMRGYPSEGRRWLERALARTESLGRTAERARGLKALGCLIWLEGNLVLARAELEEAAAIAGECGERLLQADTQRWLGFVMTDQGRPQEGRELIEKSLKVFEESGDRWNYAHALFVLGRIDLDLGDLDHALPLYESSLQIFRELGDRWGIALPIGHLGLIARRMGDAVTAQKRLEERLQLAEQTGSRQQMIFALHNLGAMALVSGENQEAKRRFRQSLELAWEAGFKISAAEDLDVLAWVAAVNHEWQRGARLMGAAAALLVGPIRDSFDMAEHDRYLSVLRSAMSEEEFNAVWAEGEAMTWEQAIEYARQVEISPADRQVTPRQAAAQEYGGLSAREREVAIHIAEGKSNRQIAQSLVISERTVTTHVANILSKLGFNSRSQVAAWAVRNGLVEKQSRG